MGHMPYLGNPNFTVRFWRWTFLTVKLVHIWYWHIVKYYHIMYVRELCFIFCTKYISDWLSLIQYSFSDLNFYFYLRLLIDCIDLCSYGVKSFIFRNVVSVINNDWYDMYFLLILRSLYKSQLFRIMVTYYSISVQIVGLQSSNLHIAFIYTLKLQLSMAVAILRMNDTSYSFT